MFGEVGDIAAPKVTHTTLVRLLTYWKKRDELRIMCQHQQQITQFYCFPTAVNQRVSF